MPAHIEVKDTPKGIRYKAIVTIGSGRGAQRITRTEWTQEAGEHALQHLQKVATGESARHDDTVSAIMSAWLVHLERTAQVEAATLARYRQVCGRLQHTTIWDRDLSLLRPRQVEDALSDLLASGLAPATVALYGRVLRAGLRWGARTQGVANVTAGVSFPQVASKPRPVVDAPTRATLVRRAAGDPLLDPFIWLAAVTGRRRNEVLALRMHDVVDVDTGLVAFRGSLCWSERQPRRIKPASGGVSIVQVPPFGIPLLRSLCVAHAAHPDAFLCSADGGKTPLCPRDVSLAFRAHADALGYEDVRLEDLRHSFVTVRVERRTDQSIGAESC